MCVCVCVCVCSIYNYKIITLLFLVELLENKFQVLLIYYGLLLSTTDWNLGIQLKAVSYTYIQIILVYYIIIICIKMIKLTFKKSSLSNT